MVEKKYDNAKLDQILEGLESINYRFIAKDKDKENDKDTLSEIVVKEHSYAKYLKDYPTLSKLTSKYLQGLLRTKYSLTKIQIKPSSKDSFYGSSNLLKNPSSIQKIMVIMPNIGNDIGIFSKTTTIFSSIKEGSVIPYIDFASSKDCSVILFNSKWRNDYDSYCESLWTNIVNLIFPNAKTIYFISQGLASISLIKLLNNHPNDFEDKVKRIFLIDSKHKELYKIFPTELKEHFISKATNYVLSSDTVGSLIYSSSISIE